MQHTLPSAGHGNTPAVAHVPALRPFVWLARGWRDMVRDPATSIGHGAVVVALGVLLLTFCSIHIDYFATALTGFMLIAPLLAAGLYGAARSMEHGEPPSFDASLKGAMRTGKRLGVLGLILAGLGIAWALSSRVLFYNAFGGTPPSIFSDINRTLLEWHYPGFFFSYVTTGAVFAAIAFVVSVVAAPMVFDRDTDALTAMATSAKAVFVNPLAMIVWAALIVALTALGFALMVVGLAVVFPVLAYATWHAYRDMVPME